MNIHKYDIYMPPSDQSVKVIQKPLCQDSTRRVPVRTFIQKVPAELTSQKLIKVVQISFLSFNKLFSIQDSPVNILGKEFRLLNTQALSGLKGTMFRKTKSE